MRTVDRSSRSIRERWPAARPWPPDQEYFEAGMQLVDTILTAGRSKIPGTDTPDYRRFLNALDSNGSILIAMVPDEVDAVWATAEPCGTAFVVRGAIQAKLEPGLSEGSTVWSLRDVDHWFVSLFESVNSGEDGSPGYRYDSPFEGEML